MMRLQQLDFRKGITLGACVGFCLMYPLSFTTSGLFIVELSSHHGLKSSTITWIAAFQSGVGGATGVLMGLLVKKFGPRLIGLMGTLIAVIGLFTGPLVDNIYYLYASFGVMFGIGSFSFVLVGFTKALQVFPKHRPLVSGILASSISVGGFMWAPVTEALIEQFTWKGALTILSGIHLHGFLLSLLLLSPSPPEAPDANGDETKSNLRDNDKKEIIKSESYLGDNDRDKITKGGHCKVTNGSLSEITCDKMLPSTHQAHKGEHRIEVRTFPVRCKLDWKVAGAIIMLASPLESVCHMNFYTYIPVLNEQNLFSRQQGALLLSVVSISSALCRIPAGMIGTLPNVSCSLLYALSISAAAVLSMSSMFCTIYPGMVAMCTAYGVCSGFYMSLLIPATLEHIPSKHMEIALGFQGTMDGLFIFILHGSAGFILDAVGDSNTLFFIFGSCGLTAGFLVLTLFTINLVCRPLPGNKQIEIDLKQ